MTTPRRRILPSSVQPDWTEFWINNATLAEATAALTAGALCVAHYKPHLCCAPAEGGTRLLTALIDEALEESQDENKVADLVCQRAVTRLQRLFQPLCKQTGGRYGYGAIQGDPRLNRGSEVSWKPPSAIVNSGITSLSTCHPGLRVRWLSTSHQRMGRSAPEPSSGTGTKAPTQHRSWLAEPSRHQYRTVLYARQALAEFLPKYGQPKGCERTG